jgi:hypothetical protein
LSTPLCRQHGAPDPPTLLRVPLLTSSSQISRLPSQQIADPVDR